MRRREFITLLGAFTLPLAAHAQQPTKKIPRVGVLWRAGSAEEEAIYLGALVEGLKGLGATENRAASPIVEKEGFIRRGRWD
jgi:putative tryptophan/tyrosine transport system substrate-binding protein